MLLMAMSIFFWWGEGGGGRSKKLFVRPVKFRLDAYKQAIR